MPLDNSDLLGDSPTPGGDSNTSGGMANAVDQGIREADHGDNAKQREAEEAIVKKTWKEYQEARDFDKQARVRFSKDRKYAAGKADPSWASDANLIGSFIDILVSFLYAKNPDVSIRASEKVGMQPDQNASDFAETGELVVSRLWRDGRLKKTKKKTVRSTLTVGQGWKKALMYTEKRPCPQVEKDILTQQSLMEELEAQKSALGSQISPPADVEAAKESIQMTLTGLQAKEAAAYQTGQCFDFIRADDIQVSLDVSSITDYLDADWISHDIYIPKVSLKSRFKDLLDEDIASASVYYQRADKAKESTEETIAASGEGEIEGAFQKSSSPGSGDGKSVEFVKIVEMWRKCQNIICTMIDGVKCWAVQPYPPPQATARWYPFFLDALFEVDGERHPQSLVSRLAKLQDEYSACRSALRVSRERSIPGIVFNRGQLSPEEAKKITDSTQQEYIGILPTDPNAALQNVFAAKPVAVTNLELLNTAPITGDMERISGVQEALQAGVSQQPKTATEANIQQTGFASRTNADRDSIEDVLTDLAHYSLECAIQEMRPPQAQRIAGPKAFWPYGMDVQDILTLVEVDIDAGTTGKPDNATMASNWATLLPMIEQLIVKIRGLQITDPPLATALENLMRETLKRLDDRLNLDEFIPQEPPPPPPPPVPELPKVSVSLKGMLPPEDSIAIGAQAAGLPPPSQGGVGAEPSGLPPIPGGPPPAPVAPTVPGPHTAPLKPGPAAPGAGTPKT
jgi:hypothetical protein